MICFGATQSGPFHTLSLKESSLPLIFPTKENVFLLGSASNGNLARADPDSNFVRDRAVISVSKTGPITEKAL